VVIASTAFYVPLRVSVWHALALVIALAAMEFLPPLRRRQLRNSIWLVLGPIAAAVLLFLAYLSLWGLPVFFAGLLFVVAATSPPPRPAGGELLTVTRRARWTRTLRTRTAGTLAASLFVIVPICWVAKWSHHSPEDECGHGDGDACAVLGYRSWLSGDFGVAVVYDKRACEHGSSRGCNNWGAALATGTGGIGRDVPRALALYRQACFGGEAKGCSNLAQAYSEGLVSLPKDPSQIEALTREAGKLRDRGCSAGKGWNCREKAIAIGNDPRARALFQKACDLDDPTACSAVGDAFERDAEPLERVTKEQNRARAAYYYRRGCDLGDPRGCESLARHFEMGVGAPLSSKYARTYYRRACDGGRASACERLGRMVTSEEPVDENLGTALFRKACLLGVPNACGVYASRLRKAGDADPQEAATFSRRACDGGISWACTDLGISLASGSADLTASASLYERACNGHDADGCERLADLTMTGGGGIPADAPKAIGLHALGCRYGNRSECDAALRAYRGGRDYGSASDLLRQLCDSGHAESCSELAQMFETGVLGSKPDDDTAEPLYAGACDAGNAFACARVGAMQMLGRGHLQRNETRAAALFQRSCELGDSSGCAAWGAALADGRGVVENRLAAGKYLRQGCAEGDSSACAKLKALGIDP
jgi:TPR repeat protein